MKIAILASSFPLSDSEESGFPATWLLAKALRQQGHEVLVCTVGPSDQADDKAYHKVADMDVVSVRWDLPKQQTFLSGLQEVGVFSWQIARARTFHTAFAEDLERFQPDVIECQEFNGLAYFYGASRRYPLVLRCYGPMSLLMRSGDAGVFPPCDVELSEAMELATVAAADGLISICADLADRLSAQTGRARSDWDVIPTPFEVPADIPTPAAAARDVIDKPTLLYFGRVEEQKGADILVECLPLVAKRFPNVRLRVGGKETIAAGSKEPYGNVMRARLRELGLLENVEFLGFMTREQISNEVQNADVCLFPSKYETACYTVLETITYGGVPVATKVGGLPEYHRHAESCYLVEPRSPESMADGIIDLLSNADLRKNMRAKGADYIRAVTDAQKIAARSVDVYQRAVAAHRQHANVSNSGPSGERAFSIMAERLMAASYDKALREQWLTSGALAEELDRAYHNGVRVGQSQGPQNVRSLVWAAARVTKRFVTGKLVGSKS